jgi:hypothetical protein
MSFSIRSDRRWALGCVSLFITLLMLSTAQAYAEWVEIGTSNNDATVYVDPDSIRRKGDLVKMWILYDFKATQTVLNKSYLSSRSQAEYHCTEDRHRALATTSFSGNMGSGKVRSSYSIKGKWEPVPPGTITQALWKVACAKE